MYYLDGLVLVDEGPLKLLVQRLGGDEESVEEAEEVRGVDDLDPLLDLVGVLLDEAGEVVGDEAGVVLHRHHGEHDVEEYWGRAMSIIVKFDSFLKGNMDGHFPATNRKGHQLG